MISDLVMIADITKDGCTMKKIKTYERAVQSIVDYSTGDITSCLMKEYAIKGMYNLLSCLDDIGIGGEKTKLIALPDFTFSRNDKRYNSFFPYGSIIHIDTPGEIFIPLGFRPNCCGITMLKLTKADEDINKIKARLYTLAKLDLGIASDDLNRGNHFIGIYQNLATSQTYAIIHGSFNFVKSGHNDIPGLYIDKTNYWNDKLCVYNKCDAHFPYLIGDDAALYYNFYIQHEQTTKELRCQIAQHLFPNSAVIFNETHEGFYQHNTITLGAYIKNCPFTAPIMLSAESDLSIINIISPLIDISSNIYACPHGGGYTLKYVIDGLYDFDSHIYKLQFENNAVMETTDIRKLIYDYRTNTDLIWSEYHAFGNIIDRFATVYNLKL